MVVKIDYSKCCLKDGKCAGCFCGGVCKGCAEVCPTGALRRGNLIEVDKEKCIDCWMCVDACKYGAVSLGGN